MRGKAEAELLQALRSGITPACAGKSVMRANIRNTSKDHPRVCGEKLENKTIPELTEGSPPRVRGKVIQTGADWVKCRITPACAGKRMKPICSASSPKDHPRVCGEKKTGGQAHSYGQGSPPRVRGKVILPVVNAVIIRITPACAGKSCVALHVEIRIKDHPRVCGEKSVAVIVIVCAPGSPPRVRGKDPEHGSALQQIRITPACAGKSIILF